MNKVLIYGSLDKGISSSIFNLNATKELEISRGGTYRTSDETLRIDELYIEDDSISLWKNKDLILRSINDQLIEWILSPDDPVGYLLLTDLGAQFSSHLSYAGLKNLDGSLRIDPSLGMDQIKKVLGYHIDSEHHYGRFMVQLGSGMSKLGIIVEVVNKNTGQKFSNYSDGIHNLNELIRNTVTLDGNYELNKGMPRIVHDLYIKMYKEIGDIIDREVI